jgi:hypothetical protein
MNSTLSGGELNDKIKKKTKKDLRQLGITSQTLDLGYEIDITS